MALKALYFKDGTQIPIFNTEDYSVTADTLTIKQLPNAYIYVAQKIGGNAATIINNSLLGSSLEDLDGNIWFFYKESSSLKIQIYRPTTQTTTTLTLPLSYGDYGQFAYFRFVSVTDDKYSLQITTSYASERRDVTSQYYRCAYVNGYNQNTYNFDDDLLILNNYAQTSYLSNKYCKNNDLFCSVKVAYNAKQSTTRKDYDFYGQPFSSTSYHNINFQFSSNAVKDWTEPTPPPPTGDMTMNLYQNTADKYVLDKSSYLTSIDTLTGTLRDRCDIISPTIIIERDALPNFNYVYIPTFNRYYYLNGIVSVRKNLWEISLTLDERMTYKTDILALENVIIGRAESATWYDPFYVDDKIPVTAGLRHTVTEISNTTFSRAESSYPFVVSVVVKTS